MITGAAFAYGCETLRHMRDGQGRSRPVMSVPKVTDRLRRDR